MATAEQIKALIKSYIEEDDARFCAVAMQVAAHAARQGHGRLADELRTLVDEAKSSAGTKCRKGPVPIATPRGELSELLAASYPQAKLADMVLTDALLRRVTRILREYRQQHKLHAHGLSPRRKFLLMGPPGSGKTMTASALSGELKLPLFVIQLDGLITKFMGETAAKLRLIFGAMEQTAGIYLFDEFDAIGSERAIPNDVGEMRRILTSFLQLLDQDRSNSLIVATTNHGEVLDRALFRRFDDVIEYQHPTRDLAQTMFKNSLAAFDTTDVDWKCILDAAGGLSYADLVRACEDAAKESILSGTVVVTTGRLLSALEERRSVVHR
ncbi:AAA family ATPase [Desulforhabdus sp. TSK]|uniref:AAA family ATPase n=1 Tax=Desulforhabdus sp. TSK TaxID=2925014 RepID=UPI001FC7F024|nr:ATP-binding protein [Desulforhabdus sp. TSK]GKT09115.1 ATPase [Desulforhabdus sp. TSK]